jgi:hypothetical protein
MSWPVEFDIGRIDLRNERVSSGDAERQHVTVREVLARLARQPGLVLADEVGMGKTFVALAVAVAAACADSGRRPVIIMVPPSLRGKWPRDFDVFKGLCLSGVDQQIQAVSAGSALELFKYLDDAPDRRAQIVFLAHGAFNLSLNDRWVKLAFIKRALRGIHLGERRRALPRFAADLIQRSSSFSDPEMFERLLAADFERWRGIINSHTTPEEHLGDDPIPEVLQRVLQGGDLDLVDLQNCLRELPVRESDNLTARITEARRVLNRAVQTVWPQALAQARFRSPLLILDEAHHLKNDHTRLAALFEGGDSDSTSADNSGVLNGTFERMLFLTATPFQLGHHELLNILARFASIAWDSLPGLSQQEFAEQNQRLREALDTAQHATCELDRNWRQVRWDDIGAKDVRSSVIETWWSRLLAANGETPARLQEVRRSYFRARDAMRAAGALLSPWVIRHLRSRTLPSLATPRRRRLPGDSLRTNDERDAGGLPVTQEAILPFLLAARSQALVSHAARLGDKAASHATFAEGLASSYEAFLETRTAVEAGAVPVKDDSVQAGSPVGARLARYLDRLGQVLPSRDAYSRHPKMAALVERVVDLWNRGEKVVIFCHFRATGRALARHVSAGIERRLWADLAERSGLTSDLAREKVRTTGEAFDDGRPLQRLLHASVETALQDTPDLPPAQRQQVHDIVRRFVRTPVFVARYFDFRSEAHEETLRRALAAADASGLSLEDKIRAFVSFVGKRCEENERAEYLDALETIHPGLRGERARDADDFVHDGPPLLPNVRLANGQVTEETRRRLLLGFNTPFFPEILIASSVLSEGVDLHLNCRHIIHYDLDWNPSTIEQRTGRIDRIGAKAEKTQLSIQVYMPFIAGSHDEKMFRVVTDRERWFQVLMGEEYRTDEAATDRLAERVPLPESAAAELAFRLGVVGEEGR